MMGGAVGQFAVGQFFDSGEQQITPSEDTTTVRGRLRRGADENNKANTWMGQVPRTR